LNRHRIPFVFATTYYPGFDCDYVMTDLRDGAYKVTRYLLEMGHRDILLFASTDVRTAPSQLRIEGFREAHRDCGVPLPPGNVVECSRADFYSGYTAAGEVLRRKRPDAILAINDILALGALKAAKELGWSIPADISVAGYDDVIYSSISDIPLTTVRQDVRTIAFETVSTLVRKIDEPVGNPGRVLVPCELIVRMSTGPCRSVTKSV
jgi:DNA-binding LacI/PurR family transcriptional regulator